MTDNWKLKEVLPDGKTIEIKDNGDTRTVKHSVCSCGNLVSIEYGDDRFRKDKKRIFYPYRNSPSSSIFRCEVCYKPVSDTVPGAEYEAPTKATSLLEKS